MQLIAFVLNCSGSSNSSCSLNNGESYAHNAEWHLNACTRCRCDAGLIRCVQVECPPLGDCEVRRRPSADACCPVCTGECLRSLTPPPSASSSSSHQYNYYYAANETWRDAHDDCIECRCVNGRKKCVAQGCSLLKAVNCSSGQRMVKRAGQCCPTCMDDDDDEPIDRVGQDGDKTTQVRSNNHIKYPPHCRAKLAKLSAECKLRCKHSLQLDGHRCPVCKCADEPVGKCAFECEADMAYMPLNDKVCECVPRGTGGSGSSSNLCSSTIEASCGLVCPNGLAKDANGCNVCRCHGSNSAYMT